MQAARASSPRIWLYIVGVFATIVAVIAIPNLKLARITANEASAKLSLHAINVAQAKFAASNHAKGYACTLGALRDDQLIPDSLAAGEDKGYLFEISDCGPPTPNRVYRVFAHPETKDQTGHWVFCSDQTTREKASPESREDCFDHGVAQR